MENSIGSQWEFIGHHGNYVNSWAPHGLQCCAAFLENNWVDLRNHEILTLEEKRNLYRKDD